MADPMALHGYFDPAGAVYDVAEKIMATFHGVPPQILSSASYPKTRYSPKVMELEDLMEDNVIPTATVLHASNAATSTKRKRKPRDEGGSSNKKQRGRPRVQTEDETAADRRRTQIRLAQRAYRQRKETTISCLKRRAAELEQTISQMSKTFLEFNDNIIDSGVIQPQSRLAKTLKETTERFVELAQLAASDSDIDEDTAVADLTRQGASNSALQELDDQDLNVEQASYFPNITAAAPAKITPTRSQPLDQNFESGQLIPVSSSQKSSSPNLPDFDFQLSDLNWIDLMSGPIERPLSTPIPYTYSFQETTFARRLHRSALERAFRVLTTTTISEQELQHVFRFTFTFSNRERMVKRFQEMLRRRAGEALESGTIPFVNIGGASLHYPRRDDQGRPVWPQNVIGAAKFIGPLLQSSAENQETFSSVDELITKLDFAGTWFDSYEVDQYLREKGLVLGPNASYIDVDPVMAFELRSSLGRDRSLPDLVSDRSSSPSSITGMSDSLLHSPTILEPSSSSSSSATSAAASANPSFPLPEPDADAVNTSTAPPPQYQTLELLWHHPHHPTLPFADDFKHQINLPDVGEAPPPVHANVPFIFDVDKFLDTLTPNAVCLGRAPGFRKRDIDEAVVEALQEVF